MLGGVLYFDLQYIVSERQQAKTITPPVPFPPVLKALYRMKETQGGHKQVPSEGRVYSATNYDG